MLVYITKYALTKGVYAVEVETFTDNDKMVREVKTQWPTYFHKPHWHTSKEEAIDHADKMRVAKINSLKKSIAKMEKLKFEL